MIFADRARRPLQAGVCGRRRWSSLLTRVCLSRFRLNITQRLQPQVSAVRVAAVAAAVAAAVTSKCDGRQSGRAGGRSCGSGDDDDDGDGGAWQRHACVALRWRRRCLSSARACVVVLRARIVLLRACIVVLLARIVTLCVATPSHSRQTKVRRAGNNNSSGGGGGGEQVKGLADCEEAQIVARTGRRRRRRRQRQRR